MNLESNIPLILCISEEAFKCFVYFPLNRPWSASYSGKKIEGRFARCLNIASGLIA